MASTPQNYILTLSCKDVSGIIASISRVLLDHKCFISRSRSFGDPATEQFFLRLAFYPQSSDFSFDALNSDLSQTAETLSAEWASPPLAEAIARTREELVNCDIPSPIFGHVGDGNFHVVFPILPGDADELSEVQAISDRIAGHALELGGTTTGEHGIGLGKRHLLEREHGTGVAVMRSIKQALDPLGILNPGKVL